jgi:hypothetical protein
MPTGWGGFGLLTKISTPVENTVEKPAIPGPVTRKTAFPAIFLGAKAAERPFSGRVVRVVS